MSIFRNTILVGTLALATTHTLQAAEGGDLHPFLTDKYFLDLGMYFPSRELKLSVDGSTATVTSETDFVSEFELGKSDELFALDFGWRFGEKWQFNGQYFSSDGNREKVLEDDVVWGDVTFGAGSGVRSGNEFSMIRTFFARKFSSAADHEFGLGVGIHWLEFSAFIEGDGTINGVPVGFSRESVTAHAPLPNIGGWYTHSFSPKWAFTARLDWFAADIGDYDGSLVNAAAGINFAAFEHVGFGLNYNIFELNMGVDKNGWSGNIESTYSGLFAHVTGYW